jgi:hypothetical protein
MEINDNWVVGQGLGRETKKNGQYIRNTEEGMIFP